MSTSLDEFDREEEYETDKKIMKHKSKKIKVPRFGIAVDPDQMSLSQIFDAVRETL